MTATIRLKAIGRVLDKRTINKFLKHSQTLFLFTVILSSVLFFSTSKMLKKSRKHTQLHVRVLDNDEEYRKEKSSLQVSVVCFSCSTTEYMSIFRKCSGMELSFRNDYIL